MTAAEQKEFDKFVKLVTWRVDVNRAWCATYHTKYICYSVSGTPEVARKKVQSEVLERLYAGAKRVAAQYNVPLFED